MDRKLLTLIFMVGYLVAGLTIIGSVNGFFEAKWFDGGMDLIYGLVIIYLAFTIYFSSKLSKNKNVFYVALGFFIIVGERLFQIFLQEINLKTGYQLAIVNWGWLLVDLIMVIGFLFIIKGLWSIKNG